MRDFFCNGGINKKQWDFLFRLFTSMGNKTMLANTLIGQTVNTLDNSLKRLKVVYATEVSGNTPLKLDSLQTAIAKNGNVLILVIRQ